MAFIDLSDLVNEKGFDPDGVTNADLLACRKAIEANVPGTATSTGKVVRGHRVQKAPKGSFYVRRGDAHALVFLDDHAPRVEVGFAETLRWDLDDQDHDGLADDVESAVASLAKAAQLALPLVVEVGRYASRWWTARLALRRLAHAAKGDAP